MTDKEVSEAFLANSFIDSLGNKCLMMSDFCSLFKKETENILRRFRDFINIHRVKISKNGDRPKVYSERIILNELGNAYFEQLKEQMGNEKCSNKECSHKDKCQRFTKKEGYSIFKPVISYPCTYYKEKS